VSVSFTDNLRQQYQTLFGNCVVNPARIGTINSIIARIQPNQARYQSVAGPLGIPWFFVAVIHNMECGLNFNEHLHNGDPLSARTVHVPAGRPADGQPPFTWEQSATDALTIEGFANQQDWSLPMILYRLEAYNGFGYRALTPPINTPYLWSFSNQYTSGKYTGDHQFDPNAVSTQCGAAVILFQMQQAGVITFGPAASAAAAGASVSTTVSGPAPASAPGSAMSALNLAAQFDSTVTFNQQSDAARSLQIALNTFPGISLQVDGDPGRQTSDAYQQVTGHFLAGDPLN
jgi:lysozyme family protein